MEPSLGWPNAVDQQQVAAQMRTELASCFPLNRRMTHRVILTAGGRQFVLTGHLTVGASGDLRLLAMGPMGVLAELSTTPNGKVNVGQHNRRFRESWIRKYIARDIVLLFSPPPEAELRAGRLADGTPFLERCAPESSQTFRYFFDSADKEWKGVSVYRKGRQRYHAECARTREFPGIERGAPSYFKVDAGRYRLDISVVDSRVEARN